MANKNIGIRLPPAVIDRLQEEASRTGKSITGICQDRIISDSLTLAAKDQEIARLQEEVQHLQARQEKPVPKKYKITIALTKGEYFSIKHQARTANMSMSQQGRQMLLVHTAAPAMPALSS